MAEEKKYSVIELAEIIGVPRTTINDWLGRYSQYIDFVMQGKRRAYTESSVQVLKEVSELRNAGKSSFEIENELAKRYAVHAEPAPPEQEGEDSAPPRERGEHPGMRPSVNSMRRNSSEHSSAGGGAPLRSGAEPAAGGTFPENSVPAEEADNSTRASAPVPGEDVDSLSGFPDGAYPLVARKANEELGRMIAGHIQGMSEKIRLMEEEARRARGRMWLWFLPLLLLLAAVFAVAVFAVAKMRALEENGRNMVRDAEEKDRVLEELKEQTVSLGGSSAELREAVRILENGLAEQKKQFEKTLADQRGLYENARDAELAKKEAEFALEREKFAAQKLEYLRNLERLSSDNEQIVRDLENRIRELQDQQKKSASTGGDDDDARGGKAVAAPVPPPAAAGKAGKSPAAGKESGNETKQSLPAASPASREEQSLSSAAGGSAAGQDSSLKASSASASGSDSAPAPSAAPSSPSGTP